MNWTHSEQVHLPLQSSWATAFATQYLGHSLCSFGLTSFKDSHASTLLHTYSTSKHATNCTKCLKQSFQLLMLGKSWVVIFWRLPCPPEGNKLDQGRGSIKHNQLHLQWSTRNASHRTRVRRAKDSCPRDSAEM